MHTLSKRQRAVLGEQTSKFIADTKAADQTLEKVQASRHATEAELSARSEQAEQVTAELDRGHAALTAWCQADADLADALSVAGLPTGASALPRIRAELSAISERLSDMDRQLQPALAAHARAYQEARSIRR